MKTNQFQWMTVLSCLMMSGAAHAWDVTPKVLRPGSPYVRVTKVGQASVKFERCHYGCESESCTNLGPRNAYSIKKLEQQRSKENWQISGALVGSVVGTVALAWSGAAGLVAITDSIMASFGAMVVGGAGGTAAGVMIANSLDWLNPAEQTRQAKTLNSDVIYDGDVKVDEIEKFIKRLELVLNKL